MRLYLAGPMTGHPRWNFDAFDAAANALRDNGFEVWSPHERDLEAGFDPDSNGEGFDLRAALEADVQAVLDSDGVALLDGWENSPGVLIECLIAQGAGLHARPVLAWIRATAPVRGWLRSLTIGAAATLVGAGGWTAWALAHAAPVVSVVS